MGGCLGCVRALFSTAPPEGGVHAPPPWSAPPPLHLKSCLQRKRDEFWETQSAFGGAPEIWVALRTAIENPELRAVILESADIKMPHHSWKEVYDSSGYKYELPQYVLSDPSNLIDDGGD